MIILISSKIGQANIQASLGKPEYSYFFLMREFVPVLEKLGEVIVIDDLAEIDPLYLRYRAQGRQVVFLSFSPPHQTPLGLQCPTVPVFAWEFDNLPDEPWENEPRNDWHYVFARTPAAITLSQEAAVAVRRVMGADYPVLVIPAPVWDRFAGHFPEGGWLPGLEERKLRFMGNVIDSPLLGLSADGLVRKPEPESVAELEQPTGPLTLAERWWTTRALFRGWWEEARNLIAPPAVPAELGAEAADALHSEPEPAPSAPGPAPCEVILRGVVYSTVLNPGDHRKNWIDLVSAFCWAFKEVGDATLVVKMTHHDLESYRVMLLTLLSRLAPFRCRVLVIHGFLEDAEYLQLSRLTSYYVNTSVCEGLCLPLMEFLSCGKPAIAPRHTAMLDYLDERSAFVVESAPQPASWPHDPSGKLKARLHRINWESLMNAYRSSYRMARERPGDYREMSLQAHGQLGEFCALAQVEQSLRSFLRRHLGSPAEQPRQDAEARA